MATAIRRAVTESRPVVLNVPVDLEWEEVDVRAGARSAGGALPAAQATSPDPEVLDRAVGIIASAARPIVLAGRGAALTGARDALVRLADRWGRRSPPACWARGCSRARRSISGIFGTLSNPVAADAIARADCVVAFGASLNYFTSSDGALLAGKRVVQCDLDPARIGQLTPVDAGIVGDAAKVADTIVRWLDEADHKPSGFRSPELERQLREYSEAADIDDRSTDDALDPRTFTLRLDELLPTERTVVIDAGGSCSTPSRCRCPSRRPS